VTIASDLQAAAQNTGYYGLGMSLASVPGNKMQVAVSAWAYAPPKVQPDPDAPPAAMTQGTAPSGTTPGAYTATLTYTAKGPHTVVVQAGELRVHEQFGAGDFPVYDPWKVAENTRAGSRAIERARAAAVFRAKTKIG